MRFASAALALLALPACVPALTLFAPAVAKPGGQVDIRWTSGPNDPATWTLFLVNATIFLSLFQNFGEIDPTPGHLNTTFATTIKPGTHYQLRAVENDNVDFVFAFSPEFNFTA